MLPFVDDGDRPRGELIGDGLDGRLYVDLADIANASSAHPHFVRTCRPDRLGLTDRWCIEIGGLVQHPGEIDLEEIEIDSVELCPTVMECAGNSRHGGFGLLSMAVWSGIPISRVLQRAAPRPQATQVLVEGFDEHSTPPQTYSMCGASWIFDIDELIESGGILAIGMNGAPLTPEHGAPVRLIVPGWYGCTAIKWVHRIELVDDSAAATPHMAFYASRTHQHGVPKLARDFVPAAIDFSAMAIRVERLEAERRIRVVGVVWGADPGTPQLLIRFSPHEAFEPVNGYQPRPQGEAWAFWEHVFDPQRAGRHRIELLPGDDAVTARRLQNGYYARTFVVPADVL